ncbi:MAG: SpoIIE family protein phosphatase [Phycisphaerales bacterium]
MPIRWKLILGVGGPLAIMLGVLLTYDFIGLRHEAFAMARERTQELAQRYAASLDADCRAIQQMALATARFLEVEPNPSESMLYDALRRSVESDDLIYGSCVAFEPGAFAGPRAAGPPSPLPVAPGPMPRPNPDLFCPYVFRGEHTLQRMDVADAYDYLDPKWEWYRYPRETGRAFWTEPFFDEGAGNAMMVTFVAPFFKDGAFRGTVNVDVLIADLRDRAIRGVRAGTDIFLLSRGGLLIVAPWPDAELGKSALDEAIQRGRKDIERLVRRMLAQLSGVESIRGLEDEEQQVAFYAPVPSPRWALAGVADENTIMWQVYAVLWRRAGVGVAAMAGLLIVVLAISVWLVRPVGVLAQAVSSLSEGNLDARVEGIRTNDEIGRLARAYNAMLDRLQTHVRALTRETAARHAVETELRVARDIQLSLLPREFPQRSEFRVHGVSAPARFVGGDFFDVFFAGEDLLTVVVADVSGKGVPAAMFMAVTRTMIRDLAAAGERSPAAILGRANEMLLRTNSESMFVTLIVAQYAPSTGVVRYANAGHPRPYIADAAGRTRPFGEITGTVVGALEGQVYRECEEKLDLGDRLIMYTDGVLEARATGGEFFGEKRLIAWLGRRGADTPREICEAGVREVDAFQPDGRADDVTWLVLERMT